MGLTCIGWKNKNGTSERNCKCGSWKNHWIKNSKESWSLTCSAADCNNYAEVGAHVINSNEDGEWIVPLCIACNNRTGEYSIKAGVTLVPANKALTNC
jgi:hypothetical protein